MLEKLRFFWRSIWINLNSPRTHVVADIMRRTRVTYHYKVRKLKKDREKLQKEAMAKAISENNSRQQLWTEIRKIRNKSSSSISCIDDITGILVVVALLNYSLKDMMNCTILFHMKNKK